MLLLRGRDNTYVVIDESQVGGHYGQILHLGLRDQQPVERIPMVERKACQSNGMTEVYKKNRDPLQIL